MGQVSFGTVLREARERKGYDVQSAARAAAHSPRHPPRPRERMPFFPFACARLYTQYA